MPSAAGVRYRSAWLEPQGAAGLAGPAVRDGVADHFGYGEGRIVREWVVVADGVVEQRAGVAGGLRGSGQLGVGAADGAAGGHRTASLSGWRSAVLPGWRSGMRWLACLAEAMVRVISRWLSPARAAAAARSSRSAG